MKTIFGYMGKLLIVDLTDKKVTEERISEDIARKYMGGYGIGALYLMQHHVYNSEPLGPDNIIGFLAGPFCGTDTLAASRFTVVAKSPLTHCWGDSNSGGHFGPKIKSAGYDGIFVHGRADKPVYILVNEGGAEILDAHDIWTKDTYETEDILKTKHGKDVEVCCIGPAGEKLSLIASIMHDKGRAAGRSGLGAVMGSKKLKSVVLKGNLPVPVADESRLRELSRKYRAELTGPVEFFKEIGTPAFTVVHYQEGDSPVKNWAGTALDFPDIERLDAKHLKKFISKRYACSKCPIVCGGLIDKGRGEYEYEAGSHRPEYETLSMFGSNCLNSSLESIIKINDMCNRYGLDTISTGASIAFAMECFENGLITKSETDGLDLSWGNHKAIVELTDKIGRREGFGMILADGVKQAAMKIGRGSEKFAMHIQGQEIPAHDPKYATELATTYKLDATPARHTQGSEERHPPELIPKYDRNSFSGRGEIHKKGVCMNHIVNCTGMCAFLYGSLPTIHAMPEFINAITGWGIELNELLQIGERIANIRHIFNLKMGLNPLNFKVPERIIGIPPKSKGPTAGITVDEATLYSEYLKAMDWDPDTTMPSKAKLIELNLEEFA